MYGAVQKEFFRWWWWWWCWSDGLFSGENATALGNGRPLTFQLVVQPPESSSCAADDAEYSQMTAGTTADRATHVDDDRVGGRPHIPFSNCLTTTSADDVDGQRGVELLEVPPSPTTSLRPPPLPPPASPPATTAMLRSGCTVLRPPQVSWSNMT